MVRIKFADDASGTNEYELVINPSRIQVPRSQSEGKKNSVAVIDGESVTFTAYFDSRRGRMSWKIFPTDHTNFSAQLTVLETLVFPNDGTYTDSNGYCYLTLGDIGTALGVYTSRTKIKVISINKILREGGRLMWESVELVWEDAE